jgi:multicomponent Na+:H+ antiporter subunit D
VIDSAQLPILIVALPLLGAFVTLLAGQFDRRLCLPLTLLALTGSGWCAWRTLARVVAAGPIRYHLGNWPPPVGIEYAVDHLNGLVLLVIAVVALLAALATGKSVERELPTRIALFYGLYLLLVTGLLGMTVTGDAFNLYVLLEISALTTYGLVAVGRERALLAGFNYLMLGTIGASFYLLGVGHLYIKTGSLNMADLAGLLPALYQSPAIQVAFVLIMVGIWTKMAFFPLHTWLPNSYTHAPTATGCLIAPLMTKVSVYIMLRMMFSVFTPAFTFQSPALSGTVVWLAVLAIVGGSLLALAQRDFKKMLSYLIVAEVGYMVGGAWLANRLGLTGAILHIMNDALMTLCLFLAAGAIVYRTGGQRFEDLRGLFGRMPLTMAAFAVGGLSMIGVPPTAGFFSKWYLILGGIEAGRWEFVAALIFSSLVNAVLFFRIFELAYFEKGDEPGHHGAVKIEEAPWSMLAPLLLTAGALLVVGLYSGSIVENIIRLAIPAGV